MRHANAFIMPLRRARLTYTMLVQVVAGFVWVEGFKRFIARASCDKGCRGSAGKPRLYRGLRASGRSCVKYLLDIRL
jgi:hypothetical protein